MILKINNTDYSDFIQHKVGIQESRRRIQGVNEGVSIAGSSIYDTICYKYDIRFKIKPLPRDMYEQLLLDIESTPCEVEYTSVLSDETRTISGEVSVSAISYLTDANGNRIYGECELSVSEQ